MFSFSNRIYVSLLRAFHKCVLWIFIPLSAVERNHMYMVDNNLTHIRRSFIETDMTNTTIATQVIPRILYPGLSQTRLDMYATSWQNIIYQICNNSCYNCSLRNQASPLVRSIMCFDCKLWPTDLWVCSNQNQGRKRNAQQSERKMLTTL